MGRKLIISGIGSRQTPNNILKEMIQVGAYIRSFGGWVRSGHADGADLAFELGAKDHAIVYLPYPNFNVKKDKELLGRAKVINEGDNAILDESVMLYHPAGDKLSVAAINFMRRNCAQVLGANTSQASDAVVCYADPEKLGGTGQAMRIAAAYNIPVINMFYDQYSTFDRVITFLHAIWQRKVDADPIDFKGEDKWIYGFLSNYCTVPFYWDHKKLGVLRWKSAEHALQAAKTGNKQIATKIAKALTPKQANTYGEKLKIPENYELMIKKILENKFKNPALYGMLLETQDRELLDAPVLMEVRSEQARRTCDY